MSPKAYEVHLEMFEGPLDLLLFLIKKSDLDIQNIPISKITQEYLAYLELMKELNLEIAGDFLVMAATLMQIKARSLLPTQDGMEPEESDLETELKAKLQELERFRAASNFLSEKAAATGDIFYRGMPRFEDRDKALDIRIFDLLTTLREVLDRGGLSTSVLAGEQFPIESRIDKIVKLLEARPYVILREIFEGETHRQGVITCFLAMLELIKLQRVFARQETVFGDILIYKKEAPSEPLPSVWPGAEPGEATLQASGDGSSVQTEPGVAAGPDEAVADAQPEPAAEASAGVETTVESEPDEPSGWPQAEPEAVQEAEASAQVEEVRPEPEAEAKTAEQEAPGWPQAEPEPEAEAPAQSEEMPEVQAVSETVLEAEAATEAASVAEAAPEAVLETEPAAEEPRESETAQADVQPESTAAPAAEAEPQPTSPAASGDPVRSEGVVPDAGGDGEPARSDIEKTQEESPE